MCSNGLLSQLVSLLKEHRPQGIGLMDISKEFYNMYGNRLNPNDYNYKNWYELIEELSKECGKAVVLVKRSTKQYKTDRIFIDEDAYEEWIKRFIIRKDIQTLEDLVIPVFPADVPLQHKNVLPLTSVPEEAFCQNQITSFRAEVIYVKSPNLLFVRLSHNKHIYHNLKQKLRFYDGEEDKTDPYILPKELAVVDYVCAVRNPMDWENWHRAVIVDTNGDLITLYAIDFGNIIYEERKALRLLKASLYVDPPQVIKVSLAGVAPSLSLDNKYVWTEQPIQYLKSLVDKYKSNIQCIFLYPLANNSFSVFLQSSVDIEKEDAPNKLPVYFHEMLIKNEYADMIGTDFTNLNPNNNNLENVVSEAIEEPLLAIKYEPEFDEYESPALRPETFTKEIKTEKDDKTDQSVNIRLKMVGNDKINKGVTTEVTANSEKSKEINYKRLHFTTDMSPETKLCTYFPKSNKPLIKHNYLNQDKLEMAFPCFERKYLNDSLEMEELSALKSKYFNEDEGRDAFYPSMFEYYRQSNCSNWFKGQFYPDSNFYDSWFSYKYYTSDESPFVKHKYFRSKLI